MNIEFYKVQYAEIQKLLIDLEKRLYGEISESIDGLLHELASFCARLKLHINVEENLIYPKIKESGVENSLSIAEEYKKRTMELKSSFKTYHSKWLLPSSILENEAQFREDTEKLILALRERIRKEENEIYILF
ncbi:hemerythrin HHE cation-binding domain protein [Leptospira yasudae]|uniref:Hemerythrin HHE cation-binding domain protein n=1 Tax=Leptospira yasudae TaxID=2202201 RepID=A0ABX9M6J5_9LEPT|nr:hemerythrin domain-containing protein [Leptospira yasudae]RHX81493.1 hemerythrin HHE cation-binding domain protein [Leptospira yasudae]RHX95969.1 hemerythrin HHE cation-binding domain protein [Leptospira yasudae]TGK29784.1 hemerythrin domain-containing protein [Leptospira yasudae]TGM07591.1 hemerythrin domain-containing protein [Leptospira yasudae]